MSEKLKVGYGYELGTVGSRFIALILDGLILGFITGILFSAGGNAGGGIGFVVGVIYNWYFWTRQNGQTPGKMAMNLKVVKADGSQLSDVDALIRAVGYSVSGFVFGLGYIWALFDDEHRTWHDMMAGTLVVSTK
ncbi:MAG: RDD family protein [Phototrophicaceae bacterium]